MFSSTILFLSYIFYIFEIEITFTNLYTSVL